MASLWPRDPLTPAQRALRVVNECRDQWQSRILGRVDHDALRRLIEGEVWAAERRLLGRIMELKKQRRARPGSAA